MSANAIRYLGKYETKESDRECLDSTQVLAGLGLLVDVGTGRLKVAGLFAYPANCQQVS